MTKSEKIVKAVLADLKGRKGFCWWWDDIDASIRREIHKELAEAVDKELKKP